MAIILSDYEAGPELEGSYGKQLETLQERLGHALVAHAHQGRRAIIVFEGWDAAGKDGTIERLVENWDPIHHRVWPIAAPTAQERAHHFLWRFWSKLPADGEIAVFDRSWYGRVLVERVEALASEKDWKRGYDEINEFEAQQKDAGTTIVKLFLHLTRAEQDKRFRARLEEPWTRWKITADDFRARDRRADYVAACEEMFERTDTRWAPWKVIDAQDKKYARITALAHVLAALEKAVKPAPPPLADDVVALARAVFGDEVRLA